VFLLVPAYPGCPGPKALKWLYVCVVGKFVIIVSVVLSVLLHCCWASGRACGL